MKKLVLLFLILYSSISVAEYKWPVYRVLDGDTIQFRAEWIPVELGKYISLRLYGIDTPEKGARAACTTEAALSLKSTEFTRQFVANKQPTISLMKWDKYGGRVIGSLSVDGKDLGTELIANGFARPYFGGAKKSWCD